MATGAIKTRLYNRKILPLVHHKDYFLDFLENLCRDELANSFRNDGVFDAAVVVSATGTNRVNVAPAASFRAVDGQGRTIRVNNGDAYHAQMQSLWIPPDAGVVYHVGLEQRMVDAEIEVNPRTGEIEYAYQQELVGRLGVPSSVVDNGDGTITLVVDSLTEAGKDYAGRSVRVWLTARTDTVGGTAGIGPLASTVATAYETRTIVFSGGSNRITTAGRLGQTAGSVSTNVNHYRVMLLGPTVRRLGLEDLRATAGVAFLAAVTSVALGAGITTISTLDQNVIAFSMSDVDEVLRRDSHGDMKIRVTADASDVNEPQIEVVDTDGVTVRFSVDEDGDVVCNNLTVNGTEIVNMTETVFGDVQIGDSSGDLLTVYSTTTFRADVTIGTGADPTPSLWFNASNRDFRMRGLDDFTLVLERNDATAGSSTVYVRNAGAGGVVGMWLQGDLQLGGGVGGTSTEGRVIFRGTGPVQVDQVIVGASSRVEWLANLGTDWDFYFRNTGAGVAVVRSDGHFQTDSGGVYKSLGTLQFDDANIAVTPLSDTVTFGNDPSNAPGGSLETARQSLLGAINEHWRHHQEWTWGRWITGLDQGAHSGLTFNVTAGFVWANGKRFKVAAGGVALTNNAVNLVYINEAGSLTAISTGTGAPVLRCPLFRATTSAGAITTVVDLRGRGPRANPREITVGNGGDFTTLAEAVAFARACGDVATGGYLAHTGVGVGFAAPEILVQGEVTVSATVTIDFPVVIRSVRTRGSVLKWDFNGALFTIAAGADGARIENIDAEFSLAGTQAASRFIALPSGSVDRVKIVGCHINSTNNNLNTQIETVGSATRWKIRDNEFRGAENGIIGGPGDVEIDIFHNHIVGINATAGTGIDVGDVRAKVQANRIVNHLVGINVQSGSTDTNVSDDNYLDGCGNEGIKTAAARTSIRNNTLRGCVANNPSSESAAIAFTGSHVQIVGNRIIDWQFDWAIRGSGADAQVCNNECTTDIATTNVNGVIKFSGSSDHAVVVGNFCEVARGAVFANDNGLPGGKGITLEGNTGAGSNRDRATISSNTIKNIGTVANPGVAIEPGQMCTVSSNTIRNVRGNAIRVYGAGAGADAPADVTVTANQVDESSQDTCIRISGSNVSVTANEVRGDGATNAIVFDAASVKCVAIGNVVKNSIVNNGDAGNIIANNQTGIS